MGHLIRILLLMAVEVIGCCIKVFAELYKVPRNRFLFQRRDLESSNPKIPLASITAIILCPAEHEDPDQTVIERNCPVPCCSTSDTFRVINSVTSNELSLSVDLSSITNDAHALPSRW